MSEDIKISENIPEETVSQRELSSSERIKYTITGSFWGVLSLLVFALDHITFHVLDGFLLDLIYVVAGVVSFVQFRAVIKGHTSSDLTYKGQKKRLIGKFKKLFSKK